ncbi:RIP metalloprotease RseP [Metabacillus fastidiosus]|uniref:Zinc metalloprotease n=1 Tax=Metabacillus fastidiosus TaxID=1458 RepID=A0ABU6NWJ8_9BACI|nr:RIP metalloprotease RseP [Metabacillus fastidiosus]MED4401497.1 RIP metalloprotease RseP [Metabacillus fastidiosus]MED4452934.1 RIP metalloprotease RseP [Metabacillus fastidiosus]MED4463131.1 RIP metalloprotease RseP [Metabacillus fastidiosus]
MNTVIAFILIFGSLVFFHELGHLVLAKRAGILCREFAIGFGPKLLSFKKDETVYTIRLLPIGGFVRMAGEDPEVVEVKPGFNIGLLFNRENKVEKIILNNKEKYPQAKIIEVEHADLEHEMVITGFVHGEEEESLQRFEVSEESYFVSDGQELQIAPYNRQFASKTLGQRAAAIIAGPAMNFILAFFLLIALGFIQGAPVNESRLGELTTDSAATKAGLVEGDYIQSISGQETSTWSDVVSIIRANPEKELTFVVTRGDKTFETTVVPAAVKEDGETFGRLGAYSPVDKSFFGSIKYGFVETFVWSKEILVNFGKLITGQFSIDALSGPVGIYDITDKVAESGTINLLRWAALLSINLGIVNLLPIPALDGGRLLFFLIEALRGKPIDRHKEGLVHLIGFALLMLLMLVVTWNDIQRLFL